VAAWDACAFFDRELAAADTKNSAKQRNRAVATRYPGLVHLPKKGRSNFKFCRLRLAFGEAATYRDSTPARIPCTHHRMHPPWVPRTSVLAISGYPTETLQGVTSDLRLMFPSWTMRIFADVPSETSTRSKAEMCLLLDLCATPPEYNGEPNWLCKPCHKRPTCG
jgi:hypothetical protein